MNKLEQQLYTRFENHPSVVAVVNNPFPKRRGYMFKQLLISKALRGEDVNKIDYNTIEKYMRTKYYYIFRTNPIINSSAPLYKRVMEFEPIYKARKLKFVRNFNDYWIIPFGIDNQYEIWHYSDYSNTYDYTKLYITYNMNSISWTTCIHTYNED